MPLISMIHATRGRKDLMFHCRDEWWFKKAHGKVGVDFEHIFSMDEDDPLTVDQEVKVKLSPSRLVVGMPPENNAAWNRAYDAVDPSAKVIVQVSDDFEPPHGWDTIILNRLSQAGGVDKPLVLGVADPHFTPSYSGDGLMTIIIATKAYLEKVGGFLLYPEYPSVFSDNDFTDAASINEALIDAYDVPFIHHWHGSDSDPLRDETHCRHMTTECNYQGSGVWGARMWAAFPDVKIHNAPISGERWSKNICPDYPGNMRALLIDARQRLIDAGRPGDRIENIDFPEGTWRRAWIEGRYKEAREGCEQTMAKYHLRVCQGRFLMHGAHFIWYKCTELLGDKPPIGVREHHR